MTHVQEVVGSNPGTIYWMEMTFFSLICCINCIVLFEKTENKQKEAGVGPFKKQCVLKMAKVHVLTTLNIENN